ncbi:MAG: hypothetical protein M5U28_19850 [Sandaracinaceae bacterium]|nr:hypothetical protein [Sandaracinaceae bacterium]
MLRALVCGIALFALGPAAASAQRLDDLPDDGRVRPEEAEVRALLDGLPPASGSMTPAETTGEPHFLLALVEAAEEDLTRGRFDLALARAQLAARHPTIQASHRDLRDRAERVATTSRALATRRRPPMHEVLAPLVAYGRARRDRGDVEGARRIAEYALSQLRLPDAEQVRGWRLDDEVAYCRRFLLQTPLPGRIRNPTPMSDLAFHRRIQAQLERELSRCLALLSQAR